MTNLEAFENCKRLVRKAGFTVSAGSWCDESRAYAFSVEDAGPDYYGHSLYAVQATVDLDGSWNYYHENRRIVV